MQFRHLVRKFHFYAGLVCFWYLIVLGLSSLNFNHHFGFMDTPGDTVTWSRPLFVADQPAEDLKLSETIRDSLSLIGWPLYWETWRDSTSSFHFALEQPGKRFVVDYSFADNHVHVMETRKGFWRVFNSLHGSGAVPKAPFTKLWGWYTILAAVVTLISVISGIYVWYKRSRDKKPGLYALAISLTIAILWMIELYILG